jgi:hypothetical protein
MTKLVVDPALCARLNGPLEFTDADGKTLGYFLTPSQLDQLQRAAEAQQRQIYQRGRQILPDKELLADATSVGELCPEAEMESYRGQA